jgi:hypothetical protein
MIPKSLSASALSTAETCLARYHAENFTRTPSMNNNAASVGSSVHFGLEHFVKGVYLEKKVEWSNIDYLIDMYKLGYTETFGSSDFETPEFEDGLELTKNWHERTEITDTVVSCEVKDHFMVKTSAGEIPFNYIWDRADQIDEKTFRVVDYKTIRLPVSAEDLKLKIQPRAYALAAQIKWPEAERIWVTYDLLRHDQVGAVFTKEDNINFWKFLRRATERIIATPETKVPETLNPECRFCVRKARCTALNKAITGGTIFSVTPDEAAHRKLEIDSQIKGLEALSNELDKILLAEAEARDEFEWDTDSVSVKISASKRRQVNSNAVSHVVGPELTAKYGNFTLSNVDKMLKEDVLTLEQKMELKNLISVKWGEPTAKIKPRSSLD